MRQGIFCLGDAVEFRDIRVGLLAASTAPRATERGLRLLADWQLWLFAFDDGFCDESEDGARPEAMTRRVAGLLGALDGSPAAPPPGETLQQRAPASGETAEELFRRALGELSGRLERCTLGLQRARFHAAVQGYFFAQCWEAALRAEAGHGGAPPHPAEYVRMRRHSGAVRTCIALSDVADGYVLPAEDYDDPQVVALTDLAVDVACWANDIVSYPKEVARSRIVHSLPAALGHWGRMDPQEALDEAGRMHDRQVERYLAAEKPVRARAAEPLLRYLDNLRSWMSGNVSWSRETGRYPGFAAARPLATEGAGTGPGVGRQAL
ncbi:hypothetical protein [Streptomyces sp. NPDC059247]|uniref:terpene synthase family protein n=1 Tax=Streptomyces sp. NPDC059247 TaxID=3346790 RepID=UPI0036D1940B